MITLKFDWTSEGEEEQIEDTCLFFQFKYYGFLNLYIIKNGQE